MKNIRRFLGVLLSVMLLMQCFTLVPAVAEEEASVTVVVTAPEPEEKPAEQPAPKQEAPAEKPAEEPAPKQETPAEAPAEEPAPKQEAPAEAPAEEPAPVQEAPAEEPAQAEEEPAAEQPAEDAPAEEQPAEEPAEEKPEQTDEESAEEELPEEAPAEEPEADAIAAHPYLIFSLQDGALTVTGCDKEQKDAVIPGEWSGYPVVAVGDRAFRKLEKLETVVLEEGVETIGSEAFADCTALASVELPKSLKEIADNAFEGCAALTSVTAPKNCFAAEFADAFMAALTGAPAEEAEPAEVIPEEAGEAAEEVPEETAEATEEAPEEAPAEEIPGEEEGFGFSGEESEEDKEYLKPLDDPSYVIDFNVPPVLVYKKSKELKATVKVPAGEENDYTVEWNVTEDTNNLITLTVKEGDNKSCILKANSKSKYGDAVIEALLKMGDAEEPAASVRHTVHVGPVATSYKITTEPGNKTSATINALETREPLQLKITVKPTAARADAKWSSSDETLATVDQDGRVWPRGRAGTVKITAKALDGGKAQTSFTVKLVRLIDSVETPNDYISTVAKGKTITLKATVLPTDATNKTLEWYSDDPKIATVNKKTGQVKGINPGDTFVHARSTDGSGKETEFYVCVIPHAVSKITFSGPNTLDMSYGAGAGELFAQIYPDDANWSVAWKNSAPSVVSMKTDPDYAYSNSVTLKPLKPGTATITATATDGSGKKATYKVSVVRNATSVSIVQGDRIILKKGTSTQLKAVLEPGDTTNKVEWRSEDPKVAKVDKKTGKVTAGKLTAETTIWVKAGMLETPITVSVEEAVPATAVEINAPENLIIAAGKAVTFKAILTPTNTTEKNVVWSVETDFGQYIKIDSKSGKLTVSPNTPEGATATVTAKIRRSGSDLESHPITITAVRAATKLTLSSEPVIPAKVDLTNLEEEYILIAKDNYGAERNSDVTWTSSNKAIATVSQDGRITFTGAKGGAVTFTAQLTDGTNLKATAKTTVTITPSSVASTLDETEMIYLAKGKTRDLSKTVLWTPQATTNKGLKWISSDKTAVSVTAAGGVIKVLKTGVPVTVTATSNANQDLKVVYNVTGIPVTALKVIAESNTFNLNNPSDEPPEYEIDAGYADGDGIRRAILPITWKSSNAKLVDVVKYEEDNNITYKLVLRQSKSGKVTITATDAAGNSGKMTVNVLAGPQMITVNYEEKDIAFDYEHDEGTPAVLSGKTVRFYASVDPVNATNRNVKWIVTDEEETDTESQWATIDTTGMLEANQGITESHDVYVKAYSAIDSDVVSDPICIRLLPVPTEHETLRIEPERSVYPEWMPFQLFVEGMTNENLSWSSSDPSVAEIDSLGYVNPHGKGRTIITVTTESGLTATKEIEITYSAPYEMRLTHNDEPLEGRNNEYDIYLKETDPKYEIGIKTEQTEEGYANFSWRFSETDWYTPDYTPQNEYVKIEQDITEGGDQTKICITPKAQGIATVLIRSDVNPDIYMQITLRIHVVNPISSLKLKVNDTIYAEDTDINYPLGPDIESEIAIEPNISGDIHDVGWAIDVPEWCYSIDEDTKILFFRPSLWDAENGIYTCTVEAFSNYDNEKSVELKFSFAGIELISDDGFEKSSCISGTDHYFWTSIYGNDNDVDVIWKTDNVDLAQVDRVEDDGWILHLSEGLDQVKTFNLIGQIGETGPARTYPITVNPAPTNIKGHLGEPAALFNNTYYLDLKDIAETNRMIEITKDITPEAAGSDGFSVQVYYQGILCDNEMLVNSEDDSLYLYIPEWVKAGNEFYLNFRMTSDIEDSVHLVIEDTRKSNITYTIGEENITITEVIPTDGVVSLPGTVMGQPVVLADNLFEDEEVKAALTSLVLAEGVAAIPDELCMGCANLVTVTLPESLTSIGGSAFKGCTQLKTLRLPGQITEVPASLCEGDTALEKVILSNGVTVIHTSAFSGCTKLAKMECYTAAQE